MLDNQSVRVLTVNRSQIARQGARFPETVRFNGMDYTFWYVLDGKDEKGGAFVKKGAMYFCEPAAMLLVLPE